MPQFTVYRNRNPASRTRFPLLLDIQSDLLEPLATRVVVPLTPATSARDRGMRTLTPVFRFAGKEYLMLTPQVAGVPANELGMAAGDLTSERDGGACDFSENCFVTAAEAFSFTVPEVGELYQT